MKWIGALLFISMTTFIGLYMSKQLHDRPKHIRYVKSTLQMIEAEMMYSQHPLQEVFRILSSQAPEMIQPFFARLYQRMKLNEVDFYHIWEEEVAILQYDTALGKSEYEILVQFGKTLGQHDLIQQQKNIALTQTHLQRELENAQEQASTYGQMVRGLGVLSGLFIVLLLI